MADNKDEFASNTRPRNGDPVQRAGRDARIKQALRENLKRRKQKMRSLATQVPDKQGEGDGPVGER